MLTAQPASVSHRERSERTPKLAASQCMPCARVHIAPHVRATPRHPAHRSMHAHTQPHTQPHTRTHCAGTSATHILLCFYTHTSWRNSCGSYSRLCNRHPQHAHSSGRSLHCRISVAPAYHMSQTAPYAHRSCSVSNGTHTCTVSPHGNRQHSCGFAGQSVVHVSTPPRPTDTRTVCAHACTCCVVCTRRDTLRCMGP